MKLIGSLFACLCALILSIGSYGSTKPQAQALAEEAADYIQQQGLESARTAFTDPAGGFIRGDLYVFVSKLGGGLEIHGIQPALVGKNLENLRDPQGRYFAKEMAELAEKEGKGWVNYTWKHPTTGKLTPKATYILRVPGSDYYVGAGVFLGK